MVSESKPHNEDEQLVESIHGVVDPLDPYRAVDPADPVDLRTQLTRFLLTGVLSAVVDFGLLQVLMQYGLGYTWAKALSFVAGTLTAYLINRRWTFRAEPSTARFIAVMSLYAVMFAVQIGLFTLIIHALLGQDWTRFWASTVAFVIAQGVATITNFIVQRTVIFRVR